MAKIMKKTFLILLLFVAPLQAQWRGGWVSGHLIETLITQFKAGSVIFSNGTNLAEDNANLFWDDANNRLGIGTASPANPLDVESTSVQMKISYDNSGNKDVLFEVDSGGEFEIAADGILSLRSESGLTTFRGESGNTMMNFDGDVTRAQTLWGIKGTYGRQIVLMDADRGGIDYDHDATTNPTLFIHSQLSPNTSNNQWGSFAHDEENFVITTGANIGAGTGPTTDENAIVFAPRGAEIARADTTGVGIGTTTPDGLLNVESLTADAEIFTTADEASVSASYWGDENDNNIHGVKAHHSGDSLEVIVNNAVAMTIDSNGDVGIGTADPTSGLHLVTSETTTNGMFIDASTITDGNGLSIKVVGATMGPNGRAFDITRDVTSTFSVNEFGEVRGDDFRANDGSTSEPAFAFQDDDDTGMYRGGTDILHLITGGTERISMIADGNVGIGTTAPIGDLHVAVGAGGDTTFAVMNDGQIFADSLDTDTGTQLSITSAGEIVLESSSERLKKNIQQWETETSVMDFKPKEWRWKQGNKKGYGLVAEDVAEVLPEAALYHNGKINSWNERVVVAYLISLNQEQENKIEYLQTQICNLNERLKKIEENQ